MNPTRIYKPAAVMQAKTEAAAEVEHEQAEAPLGSKPFPLHCLPPAIAEMGLAICKAERTPESLAGCCLLGVLSASIGAGLQVKSGPNRVTRGNLYIMASGESGSGKSETNRHAAQPLSDFESEIFDRWKREKLPGLLSEKELLESEIVMWKKKKPSGPIERQEARALIELKRKALLEIEGQLVPPILSVEDITSEALAVSLAAHGECLTSFSGDAGEIINNLLGRYNKLDRTDDGIYVKAWTGDPFKQNRISRTPVILRRPWLSALWLVQREKVETILLERTLTEGGAIPRLLLCHTNCQPQFIKDGGAGISSDTAKAYEALVRDLLETFRLTAEPVTFDPAPDALRALNDYYNAIVVRWHSGELRDVTSYALRWTEQAWRIAVCLHAGKHGKQAGEWTLSLETAQAAIEMADWFSDEQLAILAAGRIERRSIRVNKLRDLAIAYGGGVTLRNLEKSHGFKPDEVERLVREFPTELRLETKQNPKGGPQSRILSPA